MSEDGGTDADLEALKRETSHGDRIDEGGREEDRRDLRSDIREELEAIDNGERQKTVSVWDGDLAAFVAALDKDENEEHLEAVGGALREAFDLEGDDVDRSEVLRLALRLGLREAAPAYVDTLRDAVGEHASERL